jgi:hypothetical protein
VFVTLGTSPDERGILLNPPGGEIVKALENCIQSDLATIKLEEFARRVGFEFEILNISAKAVNIEAKGTVVRADLRSISLPDLEERLRIEAPRLVRQIGSPLVSALAAAICKVTGKYVRISDSNLDGSRLMVTLEILEGESG